MPNKNIKKDSRSEFAAVLRKSGKKATRTRLAILMLMRKSKNPLSAQEIIERGPGADQATIYRILKSLKSSGIIKQIDLRQNHAHYELVDLKDHHHVMCLSCGRIENILGCELETTQQEILKASKHFSEIRQHSLEFYGLCRSCARKNINVQKIQ